jgi:DNA-binding response OmpR family regulator
MGKKTVLLVEDDRFLSSLLRNRLEKEGISVIYAEDGEAAIQSLKQIRPDLVLLDIILPKKSGFEVLEAIQQDPTLKDGPVVIISNLGQEGDMERGKELGAIRYFVKAQTSIDDLVMNVKQMVGG